MRGSFVSALPTRHNRMASSTSPPVRAPRRPLSRIGQSDLVMSSIEHTMAHGSRYSLPMSQNTRKAIGNRIRELRKSQKLSQQKLALMVNVERSYLAKIEGGKRNPRTVVPRQGGGGQPQRHHRLHGEGRARLGRDAGSAVRGLVGFLSHGRKRIFDIDVGRERHRTSRGLVFCKSA